MTDEPWDDPFFVGEALASDDERLFVHETEIGFSLSEKSPHPGTNPQLDVRKTSPKLDNDDEAAQSTEPACQPGCSEGKHAGRDSAAPLPEF